MTKSNSNLFRNILEANHESCLKVPRNHACAAQYALSASDVHLCAHFDVRRGVFDLMFFVRALGHVKLAMNII